MVEIEKILFCIIFTIVAVQRISELFLSRKNTKIAISKGAIEFGRNHYFLFFILHMGWMVSWAFESLKYGSLSPIWTLCAIVFIFAEFLRYWAIQTLGENWNTRIFVIPGNKKVTGGPYKFLSHPNYAAVILEIFFLPLIFNAFYTAVIFSILNLIVLFKIRIPEENRAWRKHNE
ncbi:MAG: hypothetical protein IT569_08195 [Leptospiraceae bacterium]|nr:hypothetical protein [Leptospiraceae bacterium]